MSTPLGVLYSMHSHQGRNRPQGEKTWFFRDEKNLSDHKS